MTESWMITVVAVDSASVEIVSRLRDKTVVASVEVRYVAEVDVATIVLV
jgi:hypothetical protein